MIRGYAEFYIDGDLQLNRTHLVTVGMPILCDNLCHIGSGTGLETDAQLDEIRFYNRSLGPDEVNETRDVRLITPPAWIETPLTINTTLANGQIFLNWTGNNADCVLNDTRFNCYANNATNQARFNWSLAVSTYAEIEVNITNVNGTDTFITAFNLTVLEPPVFNQTFKSYNTSLGESEILLNYTGLVSDCFTNDTDIFCLELNASK